MKILIGNGRTLEVRDIGPVIYQLKAEGRSMIKLHGYFIMDDDSARDKLRELLEGEGISGEVV